MGVKELSLIRKEPFSICRVIGDTEHRMTAHRTGLNYWMLAYWNSDTKTVQYPIDRVFGNPVPEVMEAALDAHIAQAKRVKDEEKRVDEAIAEGIRIGFC